MQRVDLCQFRLSRAAKILEELGPLFQSGPADDLLHLRSEVHVRIPIAGNHILGPRFGLLEQLFQVGATSWSGVFIQI